MGGLQAGKVVNPRRALNSGLVNYNRPIRSSGADPQEAHQLLRWKVQGGGQRQAVWESSLNVRPPAQQGRREMRGTYWEY